MANTYSFISKVVVGAGGTSEIVFSGIPSIYSDLKLVFSGKTNNNSFVSYMLTINGSSSNISQQQLTGNSSSQSASQNGSQYFLPNTWTGTGSAGFSVVEAYIADYSSANASKVFVQKGGSTGGTSTVYTGLISGRYNNSSSISSFTLGEAGTTIQEYSTAYLYGITRVV
jgi:hypothetical protein